MKTNFYVKIEINKNLSIQIIHSNFLLKGSEKSKEKDGTLLTLEV